MNWYNVGPGEYDFFYLNEDKKIEKFTSTVGMGVRVAAVKDAPIRRDPKKFKKFLYMKKVDDDSYAYLGSDHYDCVCLDINGKLSVQRHLFTEGCGSKILFEYCMYTDKNLYKVMKVTDAITGIAVEGLKSAEFKEGEYEVYYSGLNYEPLSMDYKIEHITPRMYLFTEIEDKIKKNVMCLVEKETGDMYLSEADYRLDYIDIEGMEGYSYLQACRGDEIEEIILDAYMANRYTYKETPIKEMKSLRYQGYEESVFPVRKELTLFENIEPIVGEFEKEYAEEIERLNEEYRKEIEEFRKKNSF